MARSGGGAGTDLRAVLQVATEGEQKAIGDIARLLETAFDELDEKSMRTFYRMAEQADQVAQNLRLAETDAELEAAARQLQLVNDEAAKFAQRLSKSNDLTVQQKDAFRQVAEQIENSSKQVTDYYETQENQLKQQRELEEEAAKQRRQEIEQRTADMQDYFQMVRKSQLQIADQQQSLAQRAAGRGVQGGAGALAPASGEQLRNIKSSLNEVGSAAQRTGKKLRTGMLNQEMLRVMQDIQFGALGVANNVQQIGERLAHIPEGTTKMQALGASVKSLVTGPFAIATLVTALTLLAQNWDKVAESAQWVADQFSGVSDESRRLQANLDALTDVDLTTWAENTSLQNLRDEINETRSAQETWFEAYNRINRLFMSEGGALAGPLGPMAVAIDATYQQMMGSSDLEGMEKEMRERLNKLQSDITQTATEMQFEQDAEIQEKRNKLAQGVSDEKEKQLKREIEILEAQREQAKVQEQIQLYVEEHDNLAFDRGQLLNLAEPGTDEWDAAQRAVQAIPRMQQEAANAVLEAEQDDSDAAKKNTENLLDRLFGDEKMRVQLMEEGLEKRFEEIRLKYREKVRELRQKRAEAESVLGDEGATAAEKTRARAVIGDVGRQMRLIPRLHTQEMEQAINEQISSDLDWITKKNEEMERRVRETQQRAAASLQRALRDIQERTQNTLMKGDAKYAMNTASMLLRQTTERGGLFNMADSFDQQLERIRSQREADLQQLRTEAEAMREELSVLGLAMDDLSGQELEQAQARYDRIEAQLQAHANRKVQIEKEAQRRMTQAQRAQMQTRVQYMQQGFGMVSQIFGSVAQMQTEQSREAFERRKDMLYGQAVMDALSAGVGIWRTWFGPEATGDPVTRGIMAAAQSAVVVAQLKAKASQIQSMTMGGGGAGGGAAATGSFAQSTRSAQTRRADRLARQRGEDRSRERGRRRNSKRNLTDEDVAALASAWNDKKIYADKRTAGKMVEMGNDHNSNTQV